MNVDLLVVGGGPSGITASLEAAEFGLTVALAEKNPYIGGRVVQLFKYFPKMCPPQCGLEIYTKTMKTLGNIVLLTNAHVQNIVRDGDYFDSRILIKPRYVNNRCTACGECVSVCPVERPDTFNLSLGSTKAVYLPSPYAYPSMYAIDGEYCKGKECSKCVEACPYGAIDLDQKEDAIKVVSKSVIIATGWKPYDAANIYGLGYGKYKDVITNIILERMASPNGPTKGKIIRLSDGRRPKKVAFVQCAGSRDENNLPYCSQICCLSSMKEALYIREQCPDSEIEIFYIDIRAYGLNENFLRRIRGDSAVKFTRGRVTRVVGNEKGNLLVRVEDTVAGRKVTKEFDLVVLATGMQPEGKEERIEGVLYDEWGFVVDQDGIYGSGVAVRPMDVRQSNETAAGAVLKALQKVVSVRGGK
ncbi:MAG: CoB--CoM heterodisulfide reductase iron-sulfur subunit A family protein [Thermoplasmatales archaeon]